MKIWIDITNSPHVLFFRPIIKKLGKKHEIIITAREHSQTIGLLKLFEIKHKKIGKHAGKSIFLKAIYATIRILQLAEELAGRKIDVVVAHQSPYAIVVGWLLKIRRRIYIFDNESAWLQNFLAIPFATKIICPEAIVKDKIFGKNLIKYQGIKEAVYLSDFRPNPKVLKELKLSKKKKIIVVRPEPWTAAYYKKEKDVLMPIIKEIIEKTDWQIVVIPRDEKQREEYKKTFDEKIVIPKKPIDGPSLLYYSDLMLGGGGTMNREAAVLGIPVISTYQEKLLAVDKWLIDRGYMHHDLNPSLDEVRKIMKQRLKKKNLSELGRKALNMIINEIA